MDPIGGGARLGRSGRALAVLLVLALAGCPRDEPGATVAPGARVLDAAGRSVDPLELCTERVAVFLFTRTDCPISNRYAPLVKRLHERYSARGVGFWLVYPDADEGDAQIRAHMDDFGYAMDYLRDVDHALVRQTEARVTPEAAVYAPGGDGPALAYRGRIDDQFVDFGKQRSAASVHDLEDALEALLAGEPVLHPRTEAIGCTIPDLD